MRRIAGLAILIVAHLLPACAPRLLPDTPVSFAGRLVSVDRGPFAGRELLRVHVKEHPDEECGVILAVHPATRLARTDRSGRTQPAEPSDLTVGVEVRAWSGTVLTSCPAQAYAEAIEVLPFAGTHPVPRARR